MCENVVSSALAALSLEEEAATRKAGKVIRNSAHQAADELPGMHDVLEALEQALAWPSRYADLASQLGVRWPKGILLHGPPGCGKTAAVLAVARQCDAVVHVVTAASIVGAFTGESERRLREAFAAAAKDAASGRCVVIFLDEVDALCPKRSSAGQHEARIVGQLLTLLDGSTALGPSQQNASPQGGGLQGAAPGHILVVGTTSRPNAVDPALRRPGRLEREILVGMPDASARASILRLLTQKLPLDETVNLQRLAETTHGYTGADLCALCREAAMCAVSASAAGAARTAESANTQQPSRRGLPGADIPPPAPGKSSPDADHGEDSTAAVDTQQNDGHVLRQLSAADFAAATKRVGPSMARGSAVEYEATSWDDIGGLDEVKQRLKQAVEWPLRHAGAFKRLGLTPPRGVLLHGPPGCSKTTLVRAAASASGATFISLSGAQLYSMYVGEGEALLRETFRRARLVAPAIVFFDELDSLVGKRVEGEQTGEVTARILSSFLTEMDGLELAQGVLVMGATNRPQALDTALVRPGRFDVVLYVPPPDEAGRLHALQIHSRSIPLAADVDLSSIAAATDCYTGAELAAICREAAMAALREGGHNAKEVHQRHFQAALAGLQPHLNETELSKYENWGRR